MIGARYLPELIRNSRAGKQLLMELGKRRFERRYQEQVERFQTGSADPGHHARALRARWRPRRSLRNLADARIALVTMETWERRSMNPGISGSLDAVHVPISDVSDLNAYRLQQERVVQQFLLYENQSIADLVLVYAGNGQVEAATLRALGAHGALVAVMCLDDKQSFDDPAAARGWPAGQLPLIGAAHVHLTNSRECMRWYDSHGVSAFHFPEAADPEFGYYPDTQKDIDVSFVGQCYGLRKPFVAALQAQGIDVRGFGRGWESGEVSDEEMFSIFARSKINLGFGYVGYSDTITCLKGRDFDVPGSGNFYLTSYDSELAECFVLGREIACYRTITDCAELIRYYLESDKLRESIAVAGRRRVISEHLWPHRVEALLRWAGVFDAGPTISSATETQNGLA